VQSSFHDPCAAPSIGKPSSHLILRLSRLRLCAIQQTGVRSEQLAAMTVRNTMPAIYQTREFAAAGGLMSYGANLIDAYHLAGVHAGRILKGENPGDLPIQQSTKVEMFINLKAAKALGITVPSTLLARADEVIE
jgi:putative ABC transport system substrate-binding protein